MILLTFYVMVSIEGVCFVSFQYGVSGKVWYLVVSIPDLCLLLYYYYTGMM